jgi:hypothetical protein
MYNIDVIQWTFPFDHLSMSDKMNMSLHLREKVLRKRNSRLIELQYDINDFIKKKLGL